MISCGMGHFRKSKLWRSKKQYQTPHPVHTTLLEEGGLSFISNDINHHVYSTIFLVKLVLI